MILRAPDHGQLKHSGWHRGRAGVGRCPGPPTPAERAFRSFVVAVDLEQEPVPDGLWETVAPLMPHAEVLDRLGATGAIAWSAALVDSASVRVKGG